ncbi:Uncharacterised protein [Cedecea neteri]|uniref:Uncharacterized protein n=1 Tax=Cedecea neteri TaxID=158822 RepID=A0A2X2SY47_9ENTR|nr:Uncharacterised protein [Cedecea neteri]
MALIPIESKFSFYQQIRVLLRKLRKNNVSDDTLLDEKFQISSTLSIDAPDGQIETLRQESDDAPVQVTRRVQRVNGSNGRTSCGLHRMAD